MFNPTHYKYYKYDKYHKYYKFIGKKTISIATNWNPYLSADLFSWEEFVWRPNSKRV